MQVTRAIFKALIAPDAIQRLYKLRQEVLPPGGHRSPWAIALCLALLAISVALLIATAWVPADMRSYIESRPDLLQVSDGDLRWSVSPMVEGGCFEVVSCVTELRGAAYPTTLAAIDELSVPGDGPAHWLLRVGIPKASFHEFAEQRVVMLSLPGFSYYRADLFIDGVFAASLFQGQRLATGLTRERLAGMGDTVTAEILFEVLPSDKTLAGNRNQEGVMVASLAEFERYRDFMGAKRTNAAGSMGHLSKIVLALFCLLLFLIVDSSAESLGLALFMGFEAAAMGVGEGWLPLGYLGVGHVQAFVHFFYQMGDLLKLFFLLQMARVAPAKAVPWLVAGTVVSIPYAVFREHAGEVNIVWAYKLSLWRDTVVGGLGALACLATLLVLRARRLPWRKAALAIAALAAAFEVVNSWIAHSDMIRIYPSVKTLFTVLQANVGYLFALSTFLNISTLENRVRSLSAAAARADKIERDLEIGQIVQKSLLKPPVLPDTVDLVCHHEAALYVSGDTYYAHWDRDRHVVAFLVSDVTGHGVQAALKASACNVLAKTLWESEQAIPQVVSEGVRLAELDRLTQKLLVEMDQVPDFNSLCGCEFNLKTGNLALYRSNFTFPIVISPRASIDEVSGPLLGEFWAPSVAATHNQKVVHRQLRRGSFVVLLSDGFMESSRDYKQFNAYLRRQLSDRDMNVSVDDLCEIILRYDAFKKKIADDRTLMVFQWTQGRAGSGSLRPDETAEEGSVGLHGSRGATSRKASA